MAGKKVYSTEWKSETLKYPLRSSVATLSHFLCSLLLKKKKKGMACVGFCQRALCRPAFGNVTASA